MEELRSHLAELGFTIPAEKFILNGSLHRFPRNGSKDSGWFIGWIHNYIKRPGQYAIASFGDWRTGEEHLYVPTNVSSAEKKLADEVIKEAKRKLAVEKSVLQKEAADKAKTRFAKAFADRLTPYLERKKIDRLYGARVIGDTLIVPMQNISGDIVGSQRILVDGQKFFEKGQNNEAAFFKIGSMEDEIYICEGFATGCSIHMATGKSVIVAFNAANLVKVAKAIRFVSPDVQITICGDDDKARKPNVGREKAEKAAYIAMGSAIFPECSGTDFNDMHCELGIEAVRKRLAPEVEVKAGFKPLGYDDSGHYFFNIERKDIFRISAFTPQNLFHLAPEQYWNETYRAGEDSKTNWQRASNDLISMSLEKGRFDSKGVRGVGVWLDRGRVVVNTGQTLILEDKERSLYWPQGEAIYVQSTHKMPKMRKVASVEECNALLDVCDMLKWKDPRSAFYLAGWIAIARIAGALPIRPHIWLTGGSGTGKSTVMSDIIQPSLGDCHGFMQVQGGTTEAGIRQTLRASSVPLIFDEFESNSQCTKERHDSIVELLRNTWSETSGQIVKGSAGGTSSAFNLCFSGLVSSVGVNLLTDADKSRFSVLELKPHGDDNEEWKRLEKAMKCIDEEFGHRLFARMVRMLPIVRQNFIILKAEIARVSRQRMGQQVGMLMAGWYALRSDEVITKEGAASIADDLNLKEENQDRETEEESCLLHLLTYRVQLDEISRSSSTIGQIIDLNPEESCNRGIQKELRKYGVMVEKDAIYISDSHASLSKIFADTRWFNWSRFLRRLNGAETVASKTFNDSLRQRATKIPRNII
jgi:putative DNA primase/helicase